METNSLKVMELLYELQQLELGGSLDSEEVKNKIENLRGQIPPNILGHYDRLMRRGKKGVAVVTDSNCPECHMCLATGTKAQLMRAEDIVICDTCARYLIYKPNKATENGLPRPVARAPRKRKSAE